MVTGPAPTRSRPAPSRSATKPDRQHAILLAAEKLFAQRGYHGVTIRQIAEEAGVPLALVGYYYGPKHELFHAIFAHWNQTIEERLTALDAASGDPAAPDTLTRIIEAFVNPVIRLRHSEEGHHYAQLVGRELAYGSQEADRVLRQFFDPLAHRFIVALQAVFPHASLADVAWGYQFALGALLHHLVDDRVTRLSQGQCEAGDPAAAARLVHFIVGGLRAALPVPPVPASRKTTTPSRRRPA
ncbi:MAG: TetR family transcriptional regulator [Hydrogenophaga sp.]|uniref:TetR/AcrR family transcriptional regulator n=1 Tax=Hydrogenophaga sp. TaxID=1904254 RepID=UPI0025C555F5|nr:TetR/AcrR family transcriptional regulator [Hydrogenophaga sp.]MBT9553229.1 TetR family transcriptional regulator [Hydrogenophaga sp.]